MSVKKTGMPSTVKSHEFAERMKKNRTLRTECHHNKKDRNALVKFCKQEPCSLNEGIYRLMVAGLKELGFMKK